MRKCKITEFIEKSKKIHGDRYDYSEVDYKNSKTDVKIICPIHGEFFQTPQAHLRGCGCPKCSNDRKKINRVTNDIIIERFNDIHKGKYDYSKVEYINPNTKVCIICPEHGEFWQYPYVHLKGSGCPKCSGRNMDTEDFIIAAKKIHGDKYDYSKSEYSKAKENVVIICPEHGEFLQSPQKHLNGQGCPECAIENRSTDRVKTFDEFVNESNNIHNGRYQYDKDSYKDCHSKVRIYCEKHEWFEQYAYDHLNGHGCPSCGMIKSDGENEIYEHICSLIGNDNVIRGDRSVLKGKEIDIYIPSLKIGFEYNGCLWHSEKYEKDKHYHINKTELCEKQGIRLIHIFEDEYMNSKGIVLSKISHLINCGNGIRIYARMCDIKEIDKDIACAFLNNNHIQGYEKAKVHLGCYYKDKLIGVMSFKKESDKCWNLCRFATDINKQCVGVGGKLFRHFIREFNPYEIKTFADRRWSDNISKNLYDFIGFKKDSILQPDYRYITNNDLNRKHKFNFRKQLLNKKYGLDSSMTEKEMCDKLGFYRIWDCGLIRYVWKKEEVEN